MTLKYQYDRDDKEFVLMKGRVEHYSKRQRKLIEKIIDKAMGALKSRNSTLQKIILLTFVAIFAITTLALIFIAITSKNLKLLLPMIFLIPTAFILVMKYCMILRLEKSIGKTAKGKKKNQWMEEKEDERFLFGFFNRYKDYHLKKCKRNSMIIDFGVHVQRHKKKLERGRGYNTKAVEKVFYVKFEDVVIKKIQKMKNENEELEGNGDYMQMLTRMIKLTMDKDGKRIDGKSYDESSRDKGSMSYMTYSESSDASEISKSMESSKGSSSREDYLNKNERFKKKKVGFEDGNEEVKINAPRGVHQAKRGEAQF